MTISIKSPTSTTSKIQQNGSDVLTVDSSNNVTVTNNLSVSGTVSSTGAITFDGGVSGDVNFDSGTLYVDATNNNVGIGTTTPSTGYGGTISNVKLALKGSGPGGNNGVATLLIGADNNHYSYLSSEHTGGGSTYLAFGTAYGAANPTERMRITNSGNVTMPYQPYFFARRSTTWTGWVPNNQTQPMLFDNVITNIGNHFNGSTGLFTAPVDGVYQFWSGIYSPGYTQTQHWPVINGGRGTTYVLYAAGTNNLTGTFFIKVNANDTIGFHAYDSASSGQVNSTSEHTFFYGHLIG